MKAVYPTGEVVDLTGEAHPVAHLFPMLDDEDMADLVASIRENGLLDPVVIHQGLILDGRNRFAACQAAGVVPRVVDYAGDDPDTYALVVNLNRRHQTPGSRALTAARAARLLGYGGATKVARSFPDLENSRVSEASAVLEWCDAVTINKVDAGQMGLSVAYDEARKLKQDDADRKAKKARLREHAPDLLARVEDGLHLDEAIAALEAREQKDREEAAQRRTEADKERQKRADLQRDSRTLLTRIIDLTLPGSPVDGFVDAWAENLGDVDTNLVNRTREAGSALLDLAERITHD